MISRFCALGIATLLGATAAFIIPKFRPSTLQVVLLFTGSYLLSITLLHLLPDLYRQHSCPTQVGLYILIGFLLQLLLCFFSQGLEHGHTYEGLPSKPFDRQLSPFSLLASLGIHAFLDGVILNNAMCTHLHHMHTGHRLLLGISLHKASEGFALVTVLNKLFQGTKIIIGYVLCFSIASPLGLWLSSYGSQKFLLSIDGLTALAAIAAGSFLHIATSLFFEATTHHHIQRHQVIAALTGAILVICLEYLL
ncbi:MAG: hypothetical protein AAFV97_00275 [Bacteroidota bacterium]